MLHPGATYQEFHPLPELAPYVKCYGLLEYNLPSSDILIDHFIPFGCPYLNIGFRGEFWIDKPIFKRVGFSTHHIAGQILRPIQLYHSGDAGMLGIFFYPSGFYQLFGLPMVELTQNSIDIEDFFGNRGKGLISQLALPTTSQQKIELCEEMLSSLLSNKLQAIDNTEEAVQYIQQNPLQQIDEVCKYFHVSPRHLRRKFKEKVGIGPKSYLRVCRFHKVLQLSHQYPQIDFQDLSFHCGYYDLSHFSREWWVFYLLNYENSITERLSARIGAELFPPAWTEEGETVAGFPLMVNYQVYRLGNHRLLAGLGTLLVTNGVNSITVMIAYELQVANTTMLRLAFTPHYLNEGYEPWGGLGVGFIF